MRGSLKKKSRRKIGNVRFVTFQMCGSSLSNVRFVKRLRLLQQLLFRIELQCVATLVHTGFKFFDMDFVISNANDYYSPCRGSWEKCGLFPEFAISAPLRHFETH